jgi:hypothetical protein
MIKLCSRWAPVAIVVMIIVNLVASYGADNMAAFHANIIALTGWIVIAYEGFVLNKKVFD